MINLEIAKIFLEIADMLEIQNVQWKPQAYRKAARALESLTEDVTTIYKKGGIKAVKNIPSIGEGLAKKIIEYIKTNHIKEYDKVKKTLPGKIDELIEVPYVGPKKARLFYEKLSISSLKQLKKAIKQHKIANLPGMGEKSEQDIKEGLEILEKATERTLLGDALPIAENIINYMKTSKHINQISIAGSSRRMKETIRDLDILISSDQPNKVITHFTRMPDIDKIFSKGTTKSTIILNTGLQVDLRVVESKSFGAALQYFTGSKEHNVKLRQLAIKKGYKLNEYGLFKKDKQIAGTTEKQVYKKLGLQYIEPELRENLGEIQAAQKNKLPKLLDIKDIKGDLHMHSNYSDGVNTIQELAEFAKKLGYEYIAITDHSKTMAIAGGLDKKRILKQIKEIKTVNNKIKNFKVLSGTEVDILANGTIDFPDDILRKLDIVIASVHSGFKKDNTERIIKAMQNEHVDMIGHPTGRLINRRPAYKINIKEIIQAAKQTNTMLEINSNPHRLDLNDQHIKLATEHNIKLAIGTDSHSTDHLHFMKYGIAQAKRAWCTKKNIINTYSLKDLKTFLK